MAVFEVELPNGHKYRVEGPDDMDEDEAISSAEQQAQRASSVPDRSSVQSFDPVTGERGEDTPVDVMPQPQTPTVAGAPVAADVPDQRYRGQTAVLPNNRDNEFLKGVSAGTDQMQGTMYGLAGLVGDSVGNTQLRDWGLQGYKENQESAGRVGPRVQSLEDVHSIGDFFDAASGWLGATTPFMATTLVGGGVGGVLGRSVARKAVERLVAKGVAREAAQAAVGRTLKDEAKSRLMAGALKTGLKRGALAGSGAASALTQQGDLYAQLKEAGIEDAVAPAWGFGAIQGALDVIPEAMILHKLLPDQVEGALKQSIIRGLAGTMAKQAPLEAGTEGAQQALSTIARITSGGADWNDKDTQAVLDNMAAGAIVGSVMGAGAEGISRVTGAGQPAAAGQKPTVESPPGEADAFVNTGPTDDQMEQVMQAEVARQQARSRQPKPEGTAADPAGPNGPLGGSRLLPGKRELTPDEIDQQLMQAVLEAKGRPPQDVSLAPDTPVTDKQLAALHDVAVNENWNRLDTAAKAYAFVDMLARAKRQLDAKNREFENDETGKVEDLTNEEFSLRAAAGQTFSDPTIDWGTTITEAGGTEAEAAAFAKHVRQLGASFKSSSMSTDPKGPVFAPEDSAEQKDWSQTAHEDIQDMDPVDQLGYFKWLINDATPEQRIAYGKFREDSRNAPGPSAGMASNTKARASEYRYHDRNQKRVPGKTTVIGKSGVMEGAAGRDGEVLRTGAGWKHALPADQHAARLAANDSDSYYDVEYLDEARAKRMGLTGGAGYYVLSKPKLDAETVRINGRNVPRYAAVRQGVARATKAWDALPKALKDGTSAYKYGIELVRKEGDKTKRVFMDARELVKMGLDLEPELKTAPRGERLSRALSVALADLMRGIDGVTYAPVNMNKRRVILPDNLVLWQPKDTNPVTVEKAKEHYQYLKDNDRTSATKGLPPEFTDEVMDAELEDQDPAFPFDGDLRTPDATPVMERGNTIQQQDEKQDVSGVIETEARQNARSSGAAPPSVRGLSAPNSTLDSKPGAPPRETLGAEASAFEERRDSRTIDDIAPVFAEDEYGVDAKVSVAGVNGKISHSLTTIVKGLKQLLKIRGEMHVVRSFDDYYAHVKARGYATFAESARRLVEDALVAGSNVPGFMQMLPDGSTAIYLSPRNSPANAIRVLAHEIGHTFFKQQFMFASPETKQALNEAFQKYKDSVAAVKHGGKYLKESELFEEWMADQLAAWVAAKKAPRTLIEFFLKNIVDGFHKIWTAISDKHPLDPSFEKFVREATTAPTVDDGVFDYNGEHKPMFADENTKLSERVGKKISSLREKHPSVDKVVENTQGIAKGAVSSFLSSVQARVRRMGFSAFNEIMSHYNLRPGMAGGFDFYGESDSRLQQYTQEYKGIVEGLSAAETNELHQELMLERDLSNIKSPKLRERAIQYRNFMAKLYRYQRNSHLPIRKVEEYFPTVADKNELLADGAVQTIFLRMKEDKVMMPDGEGNMRLVTLEDVTNIVSSLADDAYVADFDPAKVQDVDAMFKNPFVQAMRSRVLSKEARASIRSIKDKDGNSRFYSKDMGDVTFRYVNQAVRRSEYNKRLGDTTWDTDKVEMVAGENGEPVPRKYDPHFGLRKLMREAGKAGADADQQSFMYDALSAMMGTHGRIKSEYMRKASNGMMAYQNLRTMTMVLFSSFPDLANNFVGKDSFRETWASVVGGFKAAWKESAERDSMLRAIGHAADTADHLSLADFTSWNDSPGTMSSKINNKFFRAIGMHRWTNFTRALAMRVGVDYINRHAQSSTNDSKARLAELGITAEDVATWNGLRQPGYGQPGFSEEDMRDGVTPAALESVKKVTGAISRMVTETVVNARPPEKPMWGNSEQWKLVFHLKGFMYGFTNRILSRVWYDISKDGSTTPDKARAVAALAMTLPLAALGMEMKDWLQNGLWGRESSLDKLGGFGYMARVANRSGALGMASMALDVGEAGANGRAPLVALAGPTISQANDLFQYGLYHTVAGSVPVLSSFPGARDGFKKVLKGDDEE